MSPASPTSRGLYLGAICYGGQAHARFMRSVLALRQVCEAAGVPLRLDLRGGQALASRGRTMLLRSFLESRLSHLLLVDGDAAFDADQVLGSLGGEGEQQLEEGARVLDCWAARARLEADPLSDARFGDVR